MIMYNKFVDIYNNYLKTRIIKKYILNSLKMPCMYSII